ncbi:MAG TPA: class I SAM-dependent methyltransferase [Solirubrobacterales bacterium]|nr:class I SAM-dependent methyltransferase [Solirubrobacterales bacterium]
MSLAIWHEVECGSYEADLALWEELAAEADGAILDLGCGTGRVALHLARRGHTVVGLDVEPDLVAELAERGRDLPVEAVLGDARAFEIEAEIALALAPMQIVQLLASPQDRLEMLGSIAAHLLPGGRIALAIVDDLPPANGNGGMLPDVREVDSWVYSSLPLETAVDGEEIAIRRLRQTVSPSGTLAEETNEVRIRSLTAAQLEQEAVETDLEPLGRRQIPATDLHVGSTVVLLGRGD